MSYTRGEPSTVSGAIGAALPVLILLALLHRFGFLAVITRDAVNAMLLFAPVLWPPAAWHTGVLLFLVAIILAIALFAFFTSLGGRRIFSTDLLEA
ncbi:MAG TPA: hypothetical protein VJ901_15915 [Thermoanaerobaculia bacterium]|nr:hypothetical protein [Thermoanaerobaculia bacterium]